MKLLTPNPKTIGKFLAILSQDFTDSERLEIRCLREKYTAQTARFTTAQISDAVEHIEKMNATHNLYAVVNPVPETAPRDAKDKDIKRALFAFVDADDLGAADRARSSDLFVQAMEVITGKTPHLRNHIYYKFDAPVTAMSEWVDLQKMLATTLGTDEKIYNPSRLMRVAGTIAYPSSAKEKRGYKAEATELLIGGCEYSGEKHYVE